MADQDQDQEIVRKKAVRWLSPSELTSAAVRVGLSSAFGEYSDKRELEDMFGRDKFDYSVAGNRDEVRPGTDPDNPDPLWVDYVSDTGDGFAATYAVAWMLAQEELAVSTNPDGETPTIPRGHLLIHGGDLVYPTATTTEYEHRFTGPYAASLPYTDSHHPKFFAIPGNHDWYDGLTSFIRKFCDGKWLGGREMPQKRSYFSIKLTDDWWIWGIDIQFDGFIDTPQLNYFKEAAAAMGPDAGVVVVTAKPSWAYVDAESTSRPTEEMHNLDFFLKDCLNCRANFVDPEKATMRETPKANVRMMLAGDIHHYVRYKDEDNDITYLTAGGGGAYLSLTHHLPAEVTLHSEGAGEDEIIEKTLKIQPEAIYPTVEWSKKRRWYGVFAGVRNPSFASLLGGIYVVLAWLALRSLPTAQDQSDGFSATVERLADQGLGDAFRTISTAGLTSPGNIALFSFFTFVLIKFTRSTDLVRALLVGGSHAAAHIGGLFLTLALLSRLTPQEHPVLSWFVYIVGLYLLGMVVASVIFGLYLTLADLLGIHPNDLYAAQRIEHKKNFLRMRVTDDQIDVWAIGIDHVPPANAWVPRTDDRNFSEDLQLHPTEVSKLGLKSQIRIGNQRYKKARQDERPDLVLSEDYKSKGTRFAHTEVDYFKIARKPEPGRAG